MLRKFLKALRSTLRAMMKMLDGTFASVFGGGGDIVLDDDYDAPAPFEKSVENARTTEAPIDEHALRTDQRRDAALVRIYSMRALLTGERPALAPCLPRNIRDWLPGLDAGELKLIADATPDQVLQHLHQGPYIPCLRRVQRLQPVALSMEPVPAIGDDEPHEVADLRPVFSV